MTRRRSTKRFWFPILLLRDTRGRFASLRPAVAPAKCWPRVRKTRFRSSSSLS